MTKINFSMTKSQTMIFAKAGIKELYRLSVVGEKVGNNLLTAIQKEIDSQPSLCGFHVSFDDSLPKNTIEIRSGFQSTRFTVDPEMY